MCGRYTLIRLADFTDMFPWIRAPEVDPQARYNIAPTQSVAVVPNLAEPRVEFFHWGLIPYWAKDPSIGSRMINARAETVATKPMFRTALKRRRCLIPASGFYEWKKNADGTKTPMYIRMKSGKPFGFAGLWERWNSPDGSEIRSCTILTGKPNELLGEIHDRMPVIVPAEHYRQWLNPDEVSADELQSIVLPYPAQEMEAYPVSRLVNNPRVESPRCIESITVENQPETPPEPPKRQPAAVRRKKPDAEQGGLFDQ